MLPNRHNSDLDVSKFIKFTPQEYGRICVKFNKNSYIETKTT